MKEKREREAQEAKLREAARLREEQKRKAEEEEAKAKKGSSYAFSSVGEKTNPWPNGKPPAAQTTPQKPTGPSSSRTSPSRRPPAPTARTYVGTDEEAFSYRPYDQPPKKHARRKSGSSFVSEESWAPSMSTAQTTPPPSARAPYSTKDPDKIVIKAVYCFLNAFAKTPASQLVSGVGSVTDGLILRISTEGLFIDDDVRGVPQREWDVKAWTLKLVEVWCPYGGSPAAESSGSASTSSPGVRARIFRLDRGAPKAHMDAAADEFLGELLRVCREGCQHPRGGLRGAGNSSIGGSSSRTDNKSTSSQTGDWKTSRLHLLRATIRDQAGKRYLFVLDESEAWKVAVGLQRLKNGALVRSLGVASVAPAEAKATLEFLGWC